MTINFKSSVCDLLFCHKIVWNLAKTKISDIRIEMTKQWVDIWCNNNLSLLLVNRVMTRPTADALTLGLERNRDLAFHAENLAS